MEWRELTGAEKSLLNSNMQEKKNKRLLILLFGLLSVTIAVYWYGQRSDNYIVDKNIFSDYDLKSISEILLETDTARVTLKYNGSRWQVNGKFDADPDMIEVLFATLRQAEPKRPLAASLQDSVAKAMELHGVKVSLFAGDVLKKTFYAGGNPLKTQAFFLDVDRKQAYIMTIPGYRVYVSGIFELTENRWRNKFVFGFNWRNFQQLEVRYSKRHSDDFVVAMNDNYFSVQGLTEVDTASLNDFLDNISLLTVADYVEDSSYNSLAKVDPFMSISVTDIARNKYLLQLYPLRAESQLYPGLINGTQWALFQKSRIDGMVRPRNFFGK